MKVKVKVPMIAYRTVTVSVDVEREEEGDIRDYVNVADLKEKAREKAVALGISPTWEIGEDWEVVEVEAQN